MKTNKSYNLVVDSKFICDSSFLFDKSLIPANVNLITIKRKNQLVQNTFIENQILKKRYKIENLFARIKQFNRVHVRRDKLIGCEEQSKINFYFLLPNCIFSIIMIKFNI